MKIYHISFENKENPLFVQSVRVKAIDYTEAINIFYKNYPTQTKILAISQSDIDPSTIVGKVLSNEQTN